MRRSGAAGILWVGMLGAALILSACGGTATSSPSAPASSPVAGRVSVFAAASLTDVFRAIGDDFQRAHPGVAVEFNFAASSALAAQIEQAAPADVFASADTANMARLTGRGLIEGAPTPFARNLPVIIVPAANRAGIASAQDLAKPGVKLVLAGPEVPIGNYARQIIDRLAAMPEQGTSYRDAVLQRLVSNEQNVRAVLTKVELGEADAGIVYRTDALASRDRVTTVPIPEAANVVATYPAAVVRGARNAEGARAFLQFIAGPEGQARLRAAGFDAP